MPLGRIDGNRFGEGQFVELVGVVADTGLAASFTVGGVGPEFHNNRVSVGPLPGDENRAKHAF